MTNEERLEIAEAAIRYVVFRRLLDALHAVRAPHEDLYKVDGQVWEAWDDLNKLVPYAPSERKCSDG